MSTNQTRTEVHSDTVKMSKRPIRSLRLFKAMHAKHCTSEAGFQPDPSYTGRAWCKARCSCGAVSFILGPLDTNFEGYLPQSFFQEPVRQDLALRQMVCDCCGEWLSVGVNETFRQCPMCGTLIDMTRPATRRGIRGAGFGKEHATLYYRTGRAFST
jgi:predicted RNA-binding Zn-ribbon protein involved in translation (DUF1610 family)